MEDETLAEVYRVLKDPQPNAPARFIVVAEGQLRGPWPIRPFINWLYKITGQRDIPLEKPITFVARHNFTGRWEFVDRQDAAARLFIAEKQPNDT
jgi:hypothetical protein